jgi:hypothetical protein
MRNEEKELVELLGECWNKFHAMPELHPCDRQEFVFHIHALQNMVYAREGYRQYKNDSGYTVTIKADDLERIYVRNVSKQQSRSF